MKTIKLTLLLLILFPVSVGVVSACKPDHKGLVATGTAIKETRNVPAFTGISVGGAFEVYLKQGVTQEVIVESDPEVIKYIKTEVTGGVLKIFMEKTPSPWMHDVGVLNVYVTCTSLDLLDLSGAVELKGQGKITTGKLGMEVSGAAETVLDLDTKVLDLSLSGASELTFTGKAEELRMDASGASEVSAYDLLARDVKIYGSGAVEARINVSGSLVANMSGACTVKYKGNPKVEVHSSGASDVKNVE